MLIADFLNWTFSINENYAVKFYSRILQNWFDTNLVLKEKEACWFSKFCFVACINWTCMNDELNMSINIFGFGSLQGLIIGWMMNIYGPIFLDDWLCEFPIFLVEWYNHKGSLIFSFTKKRKSTPWIVAS